MIFFVKGHDILTDGLAAASYYGASQVEMANMSAKLSSPDQWLGQTSMMTALAVAPGPVVAAVTTKIGACVTKEVVKKLTDKLKKKIKKIF